MKNKHTIILINFLFFFGCEDKIEEETEEEIITIDVITSNVNQEIFYYNFSNDSIDSTNWQIMYHNLEIQGSGYSMPNFSFDSSKVSFAVDSINSFEDIVEPPPISTFKNTFSNLAYLGKYAVLSYDMSIHKVLTSELVYFIYDLETKQVFKIFFNEYSSGVVSFKYADLNYD